MKKNWETEFNNRFTDIYNKLDEYGHIYQGRDWNELATLKEVKDFIRALLKVQDRA